LLDVYASSLAFSSFYVHAHAHAPLMMEIIWLTC
jgi:hypothetical protein